MAKIPEKHYVGGITSIKKTNTQKEDSEEEEVQVTISTGDGKRIKLEGPVEVANGLAPKMQIEVIFKKAQATIKEALEDEREEKEEKEE